MRVSHELRGPLAAIRGWADLAAEGSLSSADHATAMNLIQRNADSLAGLVESLFDLSQDAVGVLALHRELLDLNEVLEFVAESVHPAAVRREVYLEERLCSEALVVSADRLRVEQIGRNLIDNALKFTPPGGEVVLESRGTGTAAEFFVRDAGVGISPHALADIFDPFQWDRPAVRPSDRGLGLGLALVRELVRLHGGVVYAWSAGWGHGSTFTVRLPLARTPLLV